MREATRRALRALDSDFFRVRYDRLMPREKVYCRAMANLGTGTHRSGDIAFTVPLFDQFLNRIQ